MSKALRRNTSSLPPLQPAVMLPVVEVHPDHYDSLAYEVTRLRAEAKQARQTLRAERRRAGSVEAVLVRHIATLQEQISDLRWCIFESLATRLMEKK